MFLQINNYMIIEEVQDRFQECFPYLKLEFYSKPHKRCEGTDKQYQYTPDRRISDIRKKQYCGALEIKSWHSVAKVEKQLEEHYGLYVQVFRSQPDGTWTQTSLSDELTLKEQMDLALEPCGVF